jgi:hypothetical protein
MLYDLFFTVIEKIESKFSCNINTIFRQRTYFDYKMPNQRHIGILIFPAFVYECNCWYHMTFTNQVYHAIDNSFFKLNLGKNQMLLRHIETFVLVVGS